MNRLLKAIEILQLHLRDNNKVKSIDSNHPSILSEKTNNSYLLFSYYNANPHICKLYNFQHKSNSKSKASYCKACNNDKHYLIQLHKVAYLKKNVDNKLCIDLRKKFDKIAKLEERYKRELDEHTQFKELLKTQPTIYDMSKEKLAKYNKLLARRINYIVLFKTIDV